MTVGHHHPWTILRKGTKQHQGPPKELIFLSCTGSPSPPPFTHLQNSALWSRRSWSSVNLMSLETDTMTLESQHLLKTWNVSPHQVYFLVPLQPETAGSGWRWRQQISHGSVSLPVPQACSSRAHNPFRHTSPSDSISHVISPSEVRAASLKISCPGILG